VLAILSVLFFLALTYTLEGARHRNAYELVEGELVAR
jgi:hypothetical protein